MGNPEGKRPLGRPRLRWVTNVKLDVTAIGLDDVDWIHLAQDKNQRKDLVNTAITRI
jgi:hypothetical protein